jgi:hypothetical protein
MTVGKDDQVYKEKEKPLTMGRFWKLLMMMAHENAKAASR